MKYYLIAGERSGDLHAGNLIKSINKLDKDAQEKAWGGEYVQQAGAKLAVHYKELAVMGFWEVIKQYPKIKKYLTFCKKDILSYKPDVVILVDFGGFNKRIAKFCKEVGIKVFYYISPKVWAWNQSRAKGLKATVDQMFCILPFEKEFFKKFDWDVDYVGNPVMDAVKAHKVDKEFINKWGIDAKKPLVALLPGSRKQELQNILPVMQQVVKQFPEYQFAVAAISNFDEDTYTAIAKEPNVKLVQEDTYNLLAHAKSAVVTSGTATLETALWKVPQVVPYRTSGASYLIGKKLVKVDYISLVNLILDREVVKELIQHEMTADNIATELKTITEEGVKRKTMLSDYEELFTILGEDNASDKAAKLMIEYLSN